MHHVDLVIVAEHDSKSCTVLQTSGSPNGTVANDSLL